MLRRARYIYPNNDLFKSPLYVINNKATSGKYNDNDVVTDVILYKNSKEQIHLLDLLNSLDNITIIFAASHTWQPFKANLSLINNFYNDYHNVYNIFIIYITEVHAADIWNIGLSAGTINYSHKNINDRFKCINKLANEFLICMPIYADNMNNSFETEYSAWPFRYYIISNNKFVHIGQPNNSMFEWLIFSSTYKYNHFLWMTVNN